MKAITPHIEKLYDKLCFNLGRIKERKNWNKLIEDGVLPRPRKRSNDE